MSPGFGQRFLLLLFIILAISGALFFVRVRVASFRSADSTNLSMGKSNQPAAKVSGLEATEQKMAEAVWAREILGEECGRTFEALWDSLNATTNKLSLIGSFPVGEIVLGHWNSPQTLTHGIERQTAAGPGALLSAVEWRTFVQGFERSGWRLDQTEFRHNRFETDEAGQPKRSSFYFSAHLSNPSLSDRAIVEGDLVVDWAAKWPREKLATVKRIDATGLTLKKRRGEIPFQPILVEQISAREKSDSIDPLMLYDLDGDGRSEIILAGKNLLYRSRDRDGYKPEPFCRYPPGFIFTGIIADFDKDGVADFLCAKADGLFLFKGSPPGIFDLPGRLVWPATPRLQNAMVLTCGDIDHDGDLDLFLAQYKVPTLGQALRPFYYDANDGYPAHLLLNDGHGNFTDATNGGFEAKRWRRTYSASFVDLNEDADLDLLVVSDFAGVDLYRNDGHGHFTDVTREWIIEPHAFGMSHTLADFNADGRLDFLAIGMTSPTVDRLEHLGLTRPGATEDPAMRSRMTFGNRLYLARPESGFQQTTLSGSIARSGWSWGSSAFDFDNDGFPDVYIANGHETKETVRDYEPEFWLHDLEVSKSKDDLAVSAYLRGKFARTRGAGWSYGGYEKNRFYWNQRAASFLEIGYLLGVALEQDSRSVVADDLDADGRVDLVVTTYEAWPEVKQTLRIYKNGLTDGGHWIGFHFAEQNGSPSPAGARVTLSFNGRSAVRQIVTGDSYRSQHANTVHFGLGEADEVEIAAIRWPNGEAVTLLKPAIDRYHFIHSP